MGHYFHLALNKLSETGIFVNVGKSGRFKYNFFK